MNRKFHVSLVLLAGCLVSSSPAWAYLDPGTGSMMIQGIIAGITGIAVVTRLYWEKVRSFFAGGTPQEAEGDLDPDANDESS